MEHPTKIRVLIADDHLILRTGLRSIIDTEPDMHVVSEASNGPQAVAAYFEHCPDVLLVDLRMPALSGVEVIKTVRERDPTAKAIILTTYEGDENIYRALQAGAHAYLLKDVPQEQLLGAIRLVASGGYHLPPEVVSRLAGRLHKPDLSARELEILKRLATGFSNKEIASALSISDSTVKNHVNSILGKLQVRDRTAAATKALRDGIVTFD